MPDRKIQPEIKPIEDIKIRKAEEQQLPNGISLFSLPFGEEDVTRIDCIFRAGSHYQKHPLVASFTNLMLKEGSKNHNSAQVAEILDFYGAWLHVSCSYHYAYLTLYSLNKYLPQTIRIIEDLIFHPTFPENEFHIQLNNRRQQFLIEQEKVQYLAHKNFLSTLYGSQHPYGKNINISDFDHVNTEQLKEFHQKYYTPENCKIVVSGKITPDITNAIKNTLGSIEREKNNLPFPSFIPAQSSSQHHIFIEKTDSVQSAIQIGRPMFNRKHPDFHKFRVLNTIFGGYFGSRLMSNIREEKGYTYGISSGLTTYLDTGHFYISTQTGIEFTKPLINEIYKEMEKLCIDLVSEKELEIVKNYMIGEHIRMFDGGFALADSFISLLVNDLDYSFYENNVEIIRNTTAKEIRDLAIKYFQQNDFYEVIAGKMK